MQQEITQRVELGRGTQLQCARYEAELARRYLKVDPDNRLIADALETDWNGRLRDLDALQREHERQNDRLLLVPLKDSKPPCEIRHRETLRPTAPVSRTVQQTLQLNSQTLCDH
ncbi:hypothetical protein NKJ52_03025 [Mesorhizobium australicum]|uniref:hypothetical protein n=1 Tax=Mesorhizobium australicum TaxID=536018 RepID=UPI00333B4415